MHGFTVARSRVRERSTEPLRALADHRYARGAPIASDRTLRVPVHLERVHARERSRTIRNDHPSPLAATGLLSLGLLIPFGATHGAGQIAKIAVNLTSTVPAKTVTLIHDGLSETTQTRAADAEDLLAEHGLFRTPEDALSVDPAAPLEDGETIVFRTAVPVTISVDGQLRTLRSPAASVASLLAQQGVPFDEHDKIAPAPAAPVTSDMIVSVVHVENWVQTVRMPVAPPQVRRFAFNLKPGATKLLEAGRPGLKEIRYAVVRTPGRLGTRRTLMVARILRMPKARIIAEGIGEYTALSELAERGIAGTLRLADSALAMVATAYTANCAGCSGTTASGKRAGHGIVAVDPRVIPLGTRMFIPGYGTAIAGDTGGAIRGRRIDLGFNSDAAAFRFGRRPVTVYLLK